MDKIALIDANISRASEGCRVIEDYLRFEVQDKILTKAIEKMRKKVNGVKSNYTEQLKKRDINADPRGKEKVSKRNTIKDILIANFKRVQEALRVLEEFTGKHIYTELRYDMYELEKKVVLTCMKKKISAWAYLISDDVEILKKWIESWVSIIQLRDKKSDKKIVLKKAKKLKNLLKESSTLFIINDYIDIALAVDADGLHTGQDDIPLWVQRRILGEHKILGRTTHNLKEGIKAEKDGADYISVWPIWKTPSKTREKWIGFNYLQKVAREITILYVAIGGINLGNLEKILPYNPPLVGIIRDYENIKIIQEKVRGREGLN